MRRGNLVEAGGSEIVQKDRPQGGNVLNLSPEWRVHHIEAQGQDFRVTAELRIPPPGCLECRANGLWCYGWKHQLYLDLPMQGHRTGIMVIRHRYRCRSCGHTFWEPLPDMDTQHRVTRRLIEHIQRESPARTFASLARETGLSDRSIRRIFQAYYTQRPIPPGTTPVCLGIDEVYLAKRSRCVLTNLETRRIVELLAVKRDYNMEY
jgi:transposase